MTPTPTETPVVPEPTSTPEPGVTPTPSPAPAPTPEPGLDIQVGLVQAGESFEMELGLNESITSPFDFYLFADTPAGVYTLYPNGDIKKGLVPLYENVGSFSNDYVKAVRPAVKIPVSMKGKTVTFYAVVVQAGNIPPVRKLSDITPTTPYVILLDKALAVID